MRERQSEGAGELTDFTPRGQRRGRGVNWSLRTLASTSSNSAAHAKLLDGLAARLADAAAQIGKCVALRKRKPSRERTETLWRDLTVSCSTWATDGADGLLLLLGNKATL